MKRLTLSLAALGAALAIHTTLATPAVAVEINPNCSSLLSGCQVNAGVLEPNGLFTAFVELPHDVCDDCTLRFRWDDNIGS